MTCRRVFHLIVDFQYQLICKGEIPDLYIGIPPHHFIVIAGYIKHSRAGGNKMHEFADHLHVRRREEAFAELPAIDNIAVKNKDTGLNAAEILK